MITGSVLALVESKSRLYRQLGRYNGRLGVSEIQWLPNDGLKVGGCSLTCRYPVYSWPSEKWFITRVVLTKVLTCTTVICKKH